MLKSVRLLIALACCAPQFPANAQPSPPAKTAYTYERQHDTFDVNKDGSYAHTAERTIRFNTEQAARQNAQIPIPVSEGQETLEILEAFTIKANGERVDVKKDAIFTQASPVAANAPMFNSQKLRFLVFPDVAINTAVTFKFRLTRFEAHLPGNFSHYQPFSTTDRIDDAKVTIIAPVDLALRTWQQGMAPATDTQADGKRTLTWVHRNVTPRTAEAFEVADRDNAPSLAVSTFADWSAMGSAYETRAATKAEVTPTIRKLAEDLTKGATDKEDEVRKIYEWAIRNVRYVALHLGTGGLVPRPAETIIETKYGDCKDYTTLMQALLAARGIDSTPVLINLTHATFKPPGVAALGAFDHAILYVPKYELFLDGTSSFARFGAIPTILQGKRALATKSGTLLKLPAPSSQNNRITKATKLELNSDGAAKATTKIVMHGKFDNAIRTQFSNVAPNILPRVVAETLARSQQRGTGSVTFTDPSDLSKALEIQATYELEDAVYFQSPGAVTVPLGFSPIPISSVAQGARIANRQTEFQCASDAFDENYEIVIPAEFKILALPKGTSFQGKVQRFSSSYHQQGNTVVVKRVLSRQQPDAYCAKEDWAEIESLRTVVIRDSKAQILIQ